MSSRHWRNFFIGWNNLKNPNEKNNYFQECNLSTMKPTLIDWMDLNLNNILKLNSDKTERESYADI